MKVSEPVVGGTAVSLAGRDKGRCYLIAGIEGERLLLTDGKAHPAAAPKRKNRRHVRLLPQFHPEIAARLGEGKVQDSAIRAVLKALQAESG